MECVADLDAAWDDRMPPVLGVKRRPLEVDRRDPNRDPISTFLDGGSGAGTRPGASGGRAGAVARPLGGLKTVQSGMPSECKHK